MLIKSIKKVTHNESRLNVTAGNHNLTKQTRPHMGVSQPMESPYDHYPSTPRHSPRNICIHYYLQKSVWQVCAMEQLRNKKVTVDFMSPNLPIHVIFQNLFTWLEISWDLTKMWIDLSGKKGNVHKDKKGEDGRQFCS